MTKAQKSTRENEDSDSQQTAIFSNALNSITLQAVNENISSRGQNSSSIYLDQSEDKDSTDFGSQISLRPLYPSLKAPAYNHNDNKEFWWRTNKADEQKSSESSSKEKLTNRRPPPCPEWFFTAGDRFDGSTSWGPSSVHRNAKK